MSLAYRQILEEDIKAKRNNRNSSSMFLSTWSYYELLRESSEKSNNSFVGIAMHDFFARKYSYA